SREIGFSSNEEAQGRDSDNVLIVRVPVEIKAQLSLVGRSTPEQLDYSIRNRTAGAEAIFDSEIGPVVSHLYQVSIHGASLDIIWPSFAENGRHLLYLIDEPQVNDASKVKCRVKQAQNVNPDSLTHIPTPSAIIYDERMPMQPYERDGQVREQYDDLKMKQRRIRARSTHIIQRLGTAKPQQQMIIDERRARAIQTKTDMKQAVKMAKAAGRAIEYKGPLSRATVVSSFIITIINIIITLIIIAIMQ
ncbi:unnamed protein product, partial [Gongylonema pulchrum]|uniref:Integrin_alpha2 domain-containing protein n=1 Tax=Gongylonema pulchrum TaxID=637853 RepID=A0A183DAI3_9BILA